jgi:hypothetical protein
LRRAVPSFTVEVRRRPRLATLNPNAQSSETKPPQGAFDRESHRASAAAFAVKKVDPSPTDVGSSPKGRILPSLVPDEPLRRPLRDVALTTAESDPPSRAPKRPSARALKRLDQASKSLWNSGFSSAESAPLAVRRDESAISRDDARAKPLPNDQQSAIGRDFPATLPSRVADRSPQSRKRTIMTRYVFGDELKPGERWKRRLLTTR